MIIVRRTTLAMLAVTLGVVVLGCATEGRRELKPDAIKLVEKEGQSLSLNDIKVYQEGDDLLVHGHIHRGNRNVQQLNTIQAHVDMEIVLIDGQVIRKTNIPYQPSIISRRGSRQAHFSTLVSIDPAEISLIRLEYHVGDHNGS